MPIDNRLFGVWKTFLYGGTAYVVENVNESVSQEIQPKYYIMGTAMPRVLAIQGAEATMDITTPLLVCETRSNRTGLIATDPVRDGLTLANSLSAVYMNPNLNVDPYMIFRNIGFSVSADQGATYKIQAVGDYNSLTSEGAGGANGFGLASPSTEGYPLPENYVYRVASFYDFDVTIGGITMGPTTGIYLRELSFDLNYNTESFSYVGQLDQRKIYGISSFEIVVKGTFIAQTRWPVGAATSPPWSGSWPNYSMPLQAPSGYGAGGHAIPTTGGHAIPTTGTFNIILRNNGGLSVIPAVVKPKQKFVFNSSSLQASTGLLTTTFEGRLWATANANTKT